MKTILITGATSGIGKVTAKELAGEGHRLILANRNRDKAQEVRADIIAASGNDAIELLDLDLTSLNSVRECAQAVLSRHDSLDLLINNAGLTSNDEIITDDGFEMQFAVNALSQLQLTLELLPLLERAAPSQVIFVTSMMHKFGKLDYDSFKGAKKYSAGGAYGQSKLAMMLLAHELADRLKGKRIAVNTLHPGAVNTGILDNYSPLAQFFLRRLFVSPEKGAKTTLYLAGLDAASAPTGKYFVSAREASPHKQVHDAVAREKLWQVCCEYLQRSPEVA